MCIFMCLSMKNIHHRLRTTFKSDSEPLIRDYNLLVIVVTDKWLGTRGPGKLSATQKGGLQVGTS